MTSDRPPLRPPLVIIAGPTAVGKTSLSIRLAKKFGAEIINADSRQIYKKLDIGTAKPTKEEQSEVPHHLVDLINPDEHFNAARFAELARSKIVEINQRGKRVFVVGGTGLYIKALVHGLFPAPPSDKTTKEQLVKEAEIYGLSFLYEKLKKVDPVSAQKIHPNDKQRIVRALEVYYLTGEPISKLQEQHRFETRQYETLKIALYRPREELYDRINRRVLQMIDQGLLEEVKSLLLEGYSPELNSMTSIGYQHIARYLKGEISLERAIELLQRDTRRYAKRQITWFKGDKEYIWLRPDEYDEIERQIDAFYKRRSIQE